jgi:hypothetical protein
MPQKKKEPTSDRENTSLQQPKADVHGAKKRPEKPHIDTTPREKIEHSIGLHVPFPQRIAPAQRPKVGMLALLAVGANILLWFFTHSLLNLRADHTPFDLWFWIIGSFACFFIALAFVGIVALLVHERTIARGILLLSAFAYLVWFRLGWYSFISIVLLLLAFWQYDWQVKVEESLRVKFSVKKSMRHGLSLTIALCLLAVSLTFYGNTIQKNDMAGTSLDPLTEIVGNTANQVLALQVPDYNPRETVDDFLLRVMSEQVKKQMSGEQKELVEQTDFNLKDLQNPEKFLQTVSDEDLESILQSLPPDARADVGDDPKKLKQFLEQGNATIQQGLDEGRTQLLAQLKIDAEGSTPIGEVIKQFIGKQIDTILGPYAMFIPPLLALTIFFTLSIFTFLYAFLIKLLAAIIFFIFRVTKFTRIRTITTDVEVATLGE